MAKVEPITYRRYLKGLLALVALALGAVLLLNLLVDPYGAYRLVGGQKFFQYKEGLSSRPGKGESLNHHGWNIVILGNSRAEIGLDPQHPGWAGLPTYNAGLSGADFFEINLAARLAMKDPNLRRMVICIDVADFQFRTPHEDYLKSLLNPEVNPIEYHLANLLSIRATEKSLTTIRNAMQHRPAGDWRMGMLEVPPKTQGHADWVMRGHHDYFSSDEAAQNSTLDPGRMRALAELLADASRRGIPVQLVELPVHAVYYERLFLNGKWELSAQWIGAIAEVVHDHDRQFPAAPVELWEFAEYSTFATEPVPARGETTTHMRWFWDAVHFKKGLGDLAIDRLTGYPPPAGMKLDDFGVLLNRENLNEHIERVKKGHEAYSEASAVQ